MANYRRVTWIHSDERGKVKYPSITALAVALGRERQIIYNYIKKGYKGDADLVPRGRPRKNGVSKRSYFEAVLGKGKR